MLTRRTEAFRRTAELVQDLCEAEGLILDAGTVDAAVRVRVATVAEEMGVTDRTALGYAPPETIAANLVRTLLKAHALNEAEKAAEPAPAPLDRGAFVYTTAPRETVCARCDEPIAQGEAVVSVPGLYRRGLAHQGCVPGPEGADDA